MATVAITVPHSNFNDIFISCQLDAAYYSKFEDLDKALFVSPNFSLDFAGGNLDSPHCAIRHPRNHAAGQTAGRFRWGLQFLPDVDSTLATNHWRPGRLPSLSRRYSLGTFPRNSARALRDFCSPDPPGWKCVYRCRSRVPYAG